MESVILNHNLILIGHEFHDFDKVLFFIISYLLNVQNCNVCRFWFSSKGNKISNAFTNYLDSN